jgi:hypothetical protein
MNAFGTKADWSTWSGAEIGKRIFHFINLKIEHSFGELMIPTTEVDSFNNNESETAKESMSEFFNYSNPPITLEDYIQRLIQYTRMAVSPVNLAVALLYIDRIERKGKCEVNKYSIFRLFSTAYLIAFKIFDDPPVMKNGEFCKIAGIPLAELNRLEFSFLKAVDFDLGVGDDMAVCQKITQMLVPCKVFSPEILICDKLPTSIDVNRWTPDSVADLETDSSCYESYEYFNEEGEYEEENDEENGDVFDRHSINENYACVLNRSSGNRNYCFDNGHPDQKNMQMADHHSRAYLLNNDVQMEWKQHDSHKRY